MPRCAIRVLGGFEVTVDGRPVGADAWRTRRAADLVKLLALQSDHQLHREEVIAALWPDLGEEAGASNLRKAIHHARRALGAPEAVVALGSMLSLRSDEVSVDADAFLAAADAAASHRYPGDALPGDRYEEWASAPRDRLRDRYLACLRGAGIWERVLEIDPADEESHRALMRRHRDAGRRADALRQFDRMRAALREHIGVGPDRQTIALYEEILAMEGGVPPTPSQRIAQLIAGGLVSLNAGDLAGAERCGREAHDLAVAARLPDELGDASTLLALATGMSGRWEEMFREDFALSLDQDDELANGIFDAHMCFIEYHVSGSDPFACAVLARDLVAQAAAAGAVPAQGMAQTMLGESLLLTGDLHGARAELERAYELTRDARLLCGMGLALEHLAEVDIAEGRPARARPRIAEALDVAARTPLQSHLTVRALGVGLRLARSGAECRKAADQAARMLTDAHRVCQPCSINYHVQATGACARAGELSRARNHLATAERISGMWPAGAWPAAVWEARAGLRLAEGHGAQAGALLREAADAFDDARRPVDAWRCRDAAAAVPSS
jgi:DNA-binding SARP family transcriptional activator